MTAADWAALIQRVGVWGVIALATAWFLGYRVWPWWTKDVFPLIADRWRKADSMLDEANAERVHERADFLAALDRRDMVLEKSLAGVAAAMAVHERSSEDRSALSAKRQEKMVEALASIVLTLEKRRERNL